MKIADIFKQQPVVDRSQQGTTQRAAQEKAAQEQQTGATSSSDTVTISSRARSFAAVSRVLAEDESARSARVQELKEQVDAGSFEVESEKVAESIVAFANDV